MTNKLILIGLILCVSSSVDSLKLGNICKPDVFKYNGLVVNSFYKIPQHVSLNPNLSLEMFNKKLIYYYPIRSIFQVLVHFVLMELMFIFQMKMINWNSILLKENILIQWLKCYRKRTRKTVLLLYLVLVIRQMF